MTSAFPSPADPLLVDPAQGEATDPVVSHSTEEGRVAAKRRVARNSVANLVRTVTTFVLGFVVPPALIRWVPDDQYKAYTLSFRVGAFVALLDQDVFPDIAAQNLDAARISLSWSVSRAWFPCSYRRTTRSSRRASSTTSSTKRDTAGRRPRGHLSTTP